MRARPLRTWLLAGLLGGLALAHVVPELRAQPPPAPAPPAVTQPAAPGEDQGAPAHAGGEGTAAHPDHSTLVKNLLVGLLLILVFAKLGGEVFERMGQPAVLGEILVGIVMGNLTLLGLHGLEFLRGDPVIIALSELGVILLLFEVGLESNVQEMRRVGASSLLVAVIGVVSPALLGWGVARLFLPHEHPLVHLFVGATLCATSVGITARVLKDLNRIQLPESRIILGAAILDDVLGLVVLAVVGGLISAQSAGTALGGWEIAAILAKAVGFLFGAIALGGYLAPRLFRLASYLNVQHMLLVTSLGICFLLARLAAELGLAPIVGAFAAGLILDEVHFQDLQEREARSLEGLIRPITAFLVPVFFVVTGLGVDLRALAEPGVLGFALCLTLVAFLGKQACSLGVLGGGMNRLAVGLGMVPRGEVGLIFANIGLTLRLRNDAGIEEPVVGAAAFSAVVFMVMVTTLVTPPLLKWALTRGEEAPEPG